MGGSTTTQDTQQQQTTQLPPWINDAAQQNYAFAQNVSQQPLQQYQGQMVPDVAPQMQQAWNTAATAGNAGIPQFNAATAGFAGALGQTPMNVVAAPWIKPEYGTLAAPVTAAQAATAQAAAAQQAAKSQNVNASQAKLSTLGGMNLEGYMNPYTKSVIDTTLPIMDQSLANQQNALQNQANAKSAFGGSRQGITQGVLGAQGAQSEAQMAAQLNQANYAQAQAAGEFDVGQANNMGQFNATQLNQVGLANQQQANQVNMANAQQGNYVNINNAQMANAANQFNAGAQNQVAETNQAQANAMSTFNAGAANNMRQFNTTAINQVNETNQAAQQAKINSDILASSGLSSTGTSLAQAANNAFNMQNTAGAEQMGQAQAAINANQQKFNEARNYPQTQMGILQSALGMTPYGTSTTGTGQTQTQVPFDWGALATAGVGALGSVFAGKSDRRLKKNLQKVGVHKPTKTPIYAYNWKGEPPGAPKALGPMAQDLIKTIPGSVAKHPAGHLVVHPAVHGALARPAPAGTLGVMAMGHPVRQHRRRMMRPPQIRGALSG